MILKLFRTNQPIVLFIMPLMALILWSFNYFANPHAAISQSELNTQITYLSPLLKALLSKNLLTQTHCIILGFFFLIIQSYSFNRLTNKHEVFSKFTNLPVIIYLFYAFLFMYPLMFSGVIVANTFLVFAINTNYLLYRQYTAKDRVFNMGLLMGICALFFLPYVLLIPAIFASMALMKSFNWREWLLLLLGVLFIQLMFCFFTFLYDIDVRILYLSDIASTHKHSINLSYDFPGKHFRYAYYLLAFISVSAFIFYLLGIGYTSTRERRMRFCILWILLIQVVIFGYSFYLNQWLLFLPVLLVPLSFVNTHLYLNTKYKWFFDLLIYLAISGFIVFRIV